MSRIFSALIKGILATIVCFAALLLLALLVYTVGYIGETLGVYGMIPLLCVLGFSIAAYHEVI